MNDAPPRSAVLNRRFKEELISVFGGANTRVKRVDIEAEDEESTPEIVHAAGVIRPARDDSPRFAGVTARLGDSFDRLQALGVFKIADDTERLAQIGGTDENEIDAVDRRDRIDLIERRLRFDLNTQEGLRVDSSDIFADRFEAVAAVAIAAVEAAAASRSELGPLDGLFRGRGVFNHADDQPARSGFEGAHNRRVIGRGETNDRVEVVRLGDERRDLDLFHREPRVLEVEPKRVEPAVFADEIEQFGTEQLTQPEHPRDIPRREDLLDARHRSFLVDDFGGRPSTDAVTACYLNQVPAADRPSRFRLRRAARTARRVATTTRHCKCINEHDHWVIGKARRVRIVGPKPAGGRSVAVGFRSRFLAAGARRFRFQRVSNVGVHVKGGALGASFAADLVRFVSIAEVVLLRAFDRRRGDDRDRSDASIRRRSPGSLLVESARGRPRNRGVSAWTCRARARSRSGATAERQSPLGRGAARSYRSRRLVPAARLGSRFLFHVVRPIAIGGDRSRSQAGAGIDFGIASPVDTHHRFRRTRNIRRRRSDAGRGLVSLNLISRRVQMLKSFRPAGFLLKPIYARGSVGATSFDRSTPRRLLGRDSTRRIELDRAQIEFEIAQARIDSISRRRVLDRALPRRSRLSLAIATNPRLVLTFI